MDNPIYEAFFSRRQRSRFSLLQTLPGFPVRVIPFIAAMVVGGLSLILLLMSCFVLFPFVKYAERLIGYLLGLPHSLKSGAHQLPRKVGEVFGINHHHPQGAVDIWMTGAGGGIVAEALVFECFESWRFGRCSTALIPLISVPVLSLSPNRLTLVWWVAIASIFILTRAFHLNSIYSTFTSSLNLAAQHCRFWQGIAEVTMLEPAMTIEPETSSTPRTHAEAFTSATRFLRAGILPVLALLAVPLALTAGLEWLLDHLPTPVRNSSIIQVPIELIAIAVALLMALAVWPSKKRILAIQANHTRLLEEVHILGDLSFDLYVRRMIVNDSDAGLIQ